MTQHHLDKLTELCLEYQIGPEELFNDPKIGKTMSCMERITDSKIKNKGKDSIIGTTGKYYCGGPLLGKCMCCNGYCGPTNG